MPWPDTCLFLGILKGEVSLYRWPPVWLVWNQLYDNWQFLFLFAKQTDPNQSNWSLFCWIVSEEVKSLKILTTDYCRNSRKVSSGWSTGCFCHSCWSRFGSNFVKYIHVWSNGTACTFKNLFHLFEYQHLLLLRDICW